MSDYSLSRRRNRRANNTEQTSKKGPRYAGFAEYLKEDRTGFNPNLARIIQQAGGKSTQLGTNKLSQIIQAKLSMQSVNQTGDAYEKEADAVANKVIVAKNYREKADDKDTLTKQERLKAKSPAFEPKLKDKEEQ